MSGVRTHAQQSAGRSSGAAALELPPAQDGLVGLAETVGLAALDSSAEMAAMAEMAEMAGSAVPDGPPRSSTIG
ncbi:MAG: hypothetical protein ACKOAZ_04840, partial [Ilumatobacteraceae bacterium]